LAPKIHAFTPQGAAVGTWVTIDGTGLAQVSDVFFGDVRSSAISNLSSIKLSARVPQSAVVGPLRVQSAGGTNASESLFYVAPTLTQFTPALGQTGAVVTVTGVNFTGTTQVQFGDATAVFTLLSNTQLTTTVPLNAQSGRIRVTNPGGSATSAVHFQVIGGEPVVSSLAPSFGPVGTQVRIQGLNLSSVSEVRFGGVVASVVTVESDTSLLVTVPPSAPSGPVTVVNPLGSATSPSTFFVGSTADLAVQLSALPNESWIGGVMELAVHIRNRGPLPAQSVALGLQIPTGTEVLDVFSSQGTSSAVGLGVTFNVGNLLPDAVMTGNVQLRLLREGRFVSITEVTSGSIDPDPSNDRATVEFFGKAPDLQMVRDANGRLFLRWPTVPDTLRVEYSDQLRSGEWTLIPDLAPIVGELRQWEVTPSQVERWYRLRNPL
jgi:hypothetical protein